MPFLSAVAGQGEGQKPVVVLDTSAGAITLELYPDKAPITVENFLKYVDEGFYDNLIFHRVIPGFMIQGGGMTDQMDEKSEEKHPPIKNESGNGLSNERGTVAMARTNDPNSATCQFFINHANNPNSTITAAATRSSARSLTAWTSSTALPRSPRPRAAGHENVPRQADLHQECQAEEQVIDQS